jgi:uncharacterized protein (TIGR02147 family)
VAPSVYDYLNYRVYLSDWFDARKGKPSKRRFATLAGCSPSLISAVINGDRNLSAVNIDAYAKVLKLDPDERTYFFNIVALDQEESREAQQDAWDRAQATRRMRNARRLDEDTLSFFSVWYYIAINELVGCVGVQEDPEWIAAHLQPPITPEEAAAALDLLLEIGVLVRDEQGRLTNAEDVWVTDHNVCSRARALALRNLHKQMISRAEESLDAARGDDRQLGTLTLCVNQETFKEMVRCTTRFHEEMIQLALKGNKDADRRLPALRSPLPAHRPHKPRHRRGAVAWRAGPVS